MGADIGMAVCGPYDGPSLTTEDIDISYGYTATRSHGMVIDYTSGDYKNLHIENVESFHGEANGLTFYKESYINLENVIINNINAGSKMNDESVAALVLPNLVPRACAVDIHDQTEINYIDGEDIDNIRINNIYGFETCDQFGIGGLSEHIEGRIYNNHVISITLGIIMILLFGFLLHFIYLFVKFLTTNNIKKTTNYQ